MDKSPVELYEARILNVYRRYAVLYKRASEGHYPVEQEAFYSFMLNAIAHAVLRSKSVDRRRRLFDGICAIDLELAEEGRGQ
jgi:hypothetical protein